MKFEELLSGLKESISGLVDKNSSTEEIAKIGEITTKLDELGKEHQKSTDEIGTLKDKLIDSIKHYGTSAKPNDENPDSEKSFEEIGAELISKGEK